MNRNSFFFYRYRFFLDLGLKFLFRGFKKILVEYLGVMEMLVLIGNNRDIIFK